MESKEQLTLQKLQEISDNFNPLQHSQIAKDIIDANISKLKDKIEQEDIENQFREQQFMCQAVAEFLEDKESLSLMKDYEND